MDIKQYLNIVDDLNEHMYERLGDNTSHYFDLSYNGYMVLITFNNIRLWDSDNDERKYVDDSSEEKEDLLGYIKQEFNKLACDINKIKFDV